MVKKNTIGKIQAVIGIILLFGIGVLWNLFGGNLTKFIFLVIPLFITLFWLESISDKQLKLESKFNLLAKDFKEHIKHK